MNTKVNMIPDSAEFCTSNMEDLQNFVESHEATAKWFSDEDGCSADSVRFLPIYAEPICTTAEVKRLKEAKTLDFLDGKTRMVKFASGEEAYADSMYEPSEGYYGTSQMMYVNGQLYPVGMSAISGLAKRAGLNAEGWEKMQKNNPKGLSEIFDRLFAETKGNLTVLIQDDKVRAVNSGSYAACPYSTVLRALKEWSMNEYPDIRFEKAFVCHDYTQWQFDMSSYTQDVLGAYPELIRRGFTPCLVVSMSHIGTASVAYQPCLRLNGTVFPIGAGIRTEHVGKGNFTERSESMAKTVEKNLFQVFPRIGEMAKEFDRLRTIKVKNAYNALLRGMSSLKIPKKQGMEAAEEFQNMYPDETSAFEIILAIIDAVAYVVRDYPADYRKHIAVTNSMERAIVGIDWAKLGDLPGDFSW